MIGVPELERILPHRHPMLLVDRVTRIVPGETLTAVKAVTVNEPWYAPGPGPKTSAAPYAYPQVLLIESWCQAAGVLATWDRPNPDVLTGDVMLFGSLSDVGFGDPVLPGSTVEHHVRLVRSLGDTLVFGGDAQVDGTTVMTVGQVLMAMRPAMSLRPQPEPR
ncbi:beta-hydroxyacyl-ACP dehydratase [Streptomyces sp. NPDC052109]|uniref:3-hydroxyacyl-ACP dehydratase FabZ family protein n=1 Tax=Streptomyces sp. NPDC052109 TaxID=3155527 RepID=UPI003439B114